MTSSDCGDKQVGVPVCTTDVGKNVDPMIFYDIESALNVFDFNDHVRRRGRLTVIELQCSQRSQERESATALVIPTVAQLEAELGENGLNIVKFLFSRNKPRHHD